MNVTLRNKLNSTYNNLSIELCNDINLGSSFTSSLPSFDFNSSFNGNGFTLSNLPVPLFSSVANSNFYNLIINANIKQNNGDSNLRPGSISYKVLSESSITLNYIGVTGQILSNNSDIGGYFGMVENNVNINFNYCYNQAEVKVPVENVSMSLGGFIGYIDANNFVKFNNCYNSGEIFSGNTAGGFIGWSGYASNKFTFEYCYNVGKIHDWDLSSTRSAHFVGHMAGATATFVYCSYNDYNPKTTYVNDENASIPSGTAAIEFKYLLQDSAYSGNFIYLNENNWTLKKKENRINFEYQYFPLLLGPSSETNSSFYKKQMENSRMRYLEITSGTDWDNLRTSLNTEGIGSDYLNSFIYLNCELTINKSVDEFRGVIIGNQCKIFCDGVSSGNQGGPMFSTLRFAYVDNFVISASFTGTNCGAVAGEMYESTVKNVGVRGTIGFSSSMATLKYAAGIAALAFGECTLNRCYNLASLYTFNDAGGLIAYVGNYSDFKGARLNISYCYNRGTIYSNSGKGGLVGWSSSNKVTINISNSYASCNIYDLYGNTPGSSASSGAIMHNSSAVLNLNTVLYDTSKCSLQIHGGAPYSSSNVLGEFSSYFLTISAANFLGGSFTSFGSEGTLLRDKDGNRYGNYIDGQRN